MKRPSRSTMFREMMKIKKENIKENPNKSAKKLPVHKRKVAKKQEEAR